MKRPHSDLTFQFQQLWIIRRSCQLHTNKLKSYIRTFALIPRSPSLKYSSGLTYSRENSHPAHNLPCQKLIPESSMSFSDINLIQVCLYYLVAVLHMPQLTCASLRQNDSRLSELSSKVSALRGITVDIYDNARAQDVIDSSVRIRSSSPFFPTNAVSGNSRMKCFLPSQAP